MKIKSVTLLVTGFMLLDGANLFSQETGTNELYPTHDKTIREIPWTTVPGHLGNATPVPSPDMTLTEAITNQEAWPAKDFPEGNWGEIQNGFQLSLRFTKPVYTNDEPIEAILLFRNITNYFGRDEYLKNVGFLDGPATFQVLPESGGSPLELSMPYAITISGKITERVPAMGSQNKFGEHLNHAYNFTNGVYRVQADIQVPHGEGSTVTRFHIKSGETTIKIEKP